MQMERNSHQRWLSVSDSDYVCLVLGGAAGLCGKVLSSLVGGPGGSRSSVITARVAQRTPGRAVADDAQAATGAVAGDGKRAICRAGRDDLGAEHVCEEV
jgi:hypothetical protein